MIVQGCLSVAVPGSNCDRDGFLDQANRRIVFPSRARTTVPDCSALPSEADRHLLPASLPRSRWLMAMSGSGDTTPRMFWTRDSCCELPL